MNKGQHFRDKIAPNLIGGLPCKITYKNYELNYSLVCSSNKLTLSPTTIETVTITNKKLEGLTKYRTEHFSVLRGKSYVGYKVTYPDDQFNPTSNIMDKLSRASDKVSEITSEEYISIGHDFSFLGSRLLNGEKIHSITADFPKEIMKEWRKTYIGNRPLSILLRTRDIGEIDLSPASDLGAFELRESESDIRQMYISGRSERYSFGYKGYIMCKGQNYFERRIEEELFEYDNWLKSISSTQLAMKSSNSNFKIYPIQELIVDATEPISDIMPIIELKA